MDESVEQHYENIWQIHPLCTVFAGGSWQTEGQPHIAGHCSPQTFLKNNLHHQHHRGLVTYSHRYKSITGGCNYLLLQVSVKGHFLVERSLDWMIKPKPGCHAEEYSTVCGLWRKSRSSDSQLVTVPPKCRLNVEKSRTSLCNPAVRDAAVHSPSSLSSLSRELLSWLWELPSPDRQGQFIVKCSYEPGRQVATLCHDCCVTQTRLDPANKHKEMRQIKI